MHSTLHGYDGANQLQSLAVVRELGPDQACLVTDAVQLHPSRTSPAPPPTDRGQQNTHVFWCHVDDFARVFEHFPRPGHILPRATHDPHGTLVGVHDDPLYTGLLLDGVDVSATLAYDQPDHLFRNKKFRAKAVFDFFQCRVFRRLGALQPTLPFHNFVLLFHVHGNDVFGSADSISGSTFKHKIPSVFFLFRM